MIGDMAPFHKCRNLELTDEERGFHLLSTERFTRVRVKLRGNLAASLAPRLGERPRIRPQGQKNAAKQMWCWNRVRRWLGQGWT